MSKLYVSYSAWQRLKFDNVCYYYMIYSSNQHYGIGTIILIQGWKKLEVEDVREVVWGQVVNIRTGTDCVGCKDHPLNCFILPTL